MRLPNAAFPNEFLLQPADLLVQQVVGLVDQADGDVGHDLGGAGLTEFAEDVVGRVGPAADAADEMGLLRVPVPQL